jgi:DHA1 family bicyclomycin/chloramphenicol resistance-like MFS transporter
LTEDRHSGPKAPASAPAQPFISLGFAALLITCTYWSIDIVSPALPEIKDSFGLSARGAGLIFSFVFLGRLFGNVPAARLLEALGSPRTAVIGGLLMTVGAAVNAISPTVEVLYFGRVIQGIGIALLVNAGLRSILFAKPGRGAAVTMFGIVSTIGGVIGLQSSGLLTGSYGWRSIFVLAAALGVWLTIIPLLSVRVGRRSSRVTPTEAKTSGTEAGVRSYFGPLAINFLIFSNYSIWVLLPLYAQNKFDVSPETTANLLFIITITHLAAAIPVNRLIRRFGSTKVLCLGLLLAVAGTLGVLGAPKVWILAIPLVCYGAGMVGAGNAAGDIVLHRGGAGSKAVSMLRQTSDLGLVVGPVIGGSIADAFGYGAPFIVYPVVMLAVTAVAAFVPGALWPSKTLETA